MFIKLHCPRRAPVFLSYYVFTAAIMHVSTRELSVFVASQIPLICYSVRTYPGDPPASTGLRRCVDMLHRMQRVWPSAWRANELLHGAKVLAHSEASGLSPERAKRAAEPSEDDTIQGSQPLEGEIYRQPQAFPSAASSDAAPNYPLGLDLPTSGSPTYYQSYPRWTHDNAIPAMAANLSTSVLPQQYSTGLVDERIQRNSERQSRFPQYWSDYSALGQMDTTYGMPVIGELVSQHPTATQGEQQIYVADQYSLYSE